MWRVKRVGEQGFVFIFFSFLGLRIAGGVGHPTSEGGGDFYGFLGEEMAAKEGRERRERRNFNSRKRRERRGKEETRIARIGDFRFEIEKKNWGMIRGG